MKLRTVLTWSWMSVAACGLLVAQGVEQDQSDPPSRVARLNYLGGSVSFRPDSVEEWTAATVNYPLTTGDHLWTDRDSGADMHIGSSVVHLADQTAFAILNLDDRMAQISLTQGAINVRIARLRSDETFEVDTPNGAIVLLRAGDYRIDVNGDANSTALIVRSGEAEVTGGGQAMPVHGRQLLRFSGNDQLSTEVLAAPSPDQFDQWCMDRDRREERAIQASASYVPAEMIGAGDLADNGVWRNDPTYGAVWAPSRMPMGWEPYRFGHWAYVMPWGWTWIDDAPWGFAPFHYGRWATMGGGWVWVPGTMVARPVYAPALVAFVGGSRFSVAVGFGGGGGVAWIPLGPREVYRPYYRTSDRYVRDVNVTHVTNVTNITNVNVTNVTYMNQTHVTVVPQGAFTGARPVAAAAVRVSPQAMSQAQAVNAMDVRPARESYMGRPAQPGVRFGAPPAQVAAREVVVRQAPPASVRPMGGVRVADPVRSNPVLNNAVPNNAVPNNPVPNNPAPNNMPNNNMPNRTQTPMPPRGDRPPAVYNNRPPMNNTPSQPMNNNAQPATPNRAPANVSPPVDTPQPRRNDTPPSYTRPPVYNQQPANNPQPPLQRQQQQQQPQQPPQQQQQQQQERQPDRQQQQQQRQQERQPDRQQQQQQQQPPQQRQPDRQQQQPPQQQQPQVLQRQQQPERQQPPDRQRQNDERRRNDSKSKEEKKQ